jgi:hypothetical protein
MGLKIEGIVKEVWHDFVLLETPNYGTLKACFVRVPKGFEKKLKEVVKLEGYLTQENEQFIVLVSKVIK